MKDYHRQTILENDISQIYHRQFLSMSVKIHCSKNAKIRVLKCATGKNIFKYQCRNDRQVKMLRHKCERVQQMKTVYRFEKMVSH